MKFISITIHHIAIPLKKTFETSFGVVSERPALIFEGQTEQGFTAFGESSPLYIPISEQEVLSDGLAALERLLPTLVGVDIESEEQFQSLIAPMNVLPVSRVGLEGMYYHARAQALGGPVFGGFGKQTTEVLVGESIGIFPTADEVISEIGSFIKDGHKRIKVKIKPGHDVEIIRAVRATFPGIILGVDANAAYTPEQRSILHELDRFGLAFVEQPFEQEEHEAHIELANELIAPLCFDESIVDLPSAKRAIDDGACAIVNIKPARIGGFWESRNIHDYCVKHGIPLFGGGRMETGIGRVLNAAFYALPGFTLPSDLTAPVRYFEQDLLGTAFHVSNGMYKSTHAPEVITQSIDRDVLKRYTVGSINQKTSH